MGRLFPFLAVTALILFTLSGSCVAADPSSAQGMPEESARPAPAVASCNVGLGPLLLRGQSAFQLLRLSLIPTVAGMVPKGHWELNATTTWTNRWAWKRDKYLIDGEVLYTAFFLGYGVTDWMQVRLEIPFCMRGGGFMDGFIEGFHDTFGYAQAGRDKFPRDTFHIEFWRKDGTTIYKLTDSDPWIGLEDLVLTGKFRLTPGTNWVPHASLVFHLKFPTGDADDLYGSGSFDGGVALCLSKRIWRFYGYVEAQYTRFGTDELAGIAMRSDQGSFLVAIEYPWTERFSILLQALINTGAAKDFYQFSLPTYEVTLGMKAEFLPDAFFEFGLIENVFYYHNSPDLGLHFGLSRRF